MFDSLLCWTETAMPSLSKLSPTAYAFHRPRRTLLAWGAGLLALIVLSVVAGGDLTTDNALDRKSVV